MQEKLLLLRRSRNLKIKDMAKKLRLAPKTYSEKERSLAEFTQDEMFLVSRLFEKKIDEIFLPRSNRIGDVVTGGEIRERR